MKQALLLLDLFSLVPLLIIPSSVIFLLIKGITNAFNSVSFSSESSHKTDWNKVEQMISESINQIDKERKEYAQNRGYIR